MTAFRLQNTQIANGFVQNSPFQHFSADIFPFINPIHWLHSHFAVGGWSPLQRLSGMLTAHMTHIAPRNGFTWHPHRGLEIYTWVLEGRLYHEDTTGGKGILEAGDLQRMFSGDYIEHQELNPWDEPARVIQIWYIAQRHYQGLPPHYQQVGKGQLPKQTIGDADVYSLIGENSPIDSHIEGRLTATFVPQQGKTTIENPQEGESLFLYVTDGEGIVNYNGEDIALNQYDVILARPDAKITTIRNTSQQDLSFLNFYLPEFLG
ncbi:MAG: pirin family protein [bacterium]|nr:pirin family protein [bacterium]